MHHPISSRRWLAILTLAWLSGLSAPALAQDNYPNKPIRMLLGYPPGGGSDIIARLVAKPLGDRLGQSVVVDNKPGAGGNIAAEMAARATPDGYTLLFVPSGLASAAAMKKSLPFQPVHDFVWVSTVITYPLALAVVPHSPIKSFTDLVAKAKADPNKITYSSVGIGSAMHLATEWIQAEAGIALNHIPFKGGVGPMTELLAGRVDVVIDTMTSTAPMLKDKRVRGLAVTGGVITSAGVVLAATFSALAVIPLLFLAQIAFPNLPAYTLEINPRQVANVNETIDALATVIEIHPRDRRRVSRWILHFVQNDRKAVLGGFEDTP